MGTKKKKKRERERGFETVRTAWLVGPIRYASNLSSTSRNCISCNYLVRILRTELLLPLSPTSTLGICGDGICVAKAEQVIQEGFGGPLLDP